MWTDEVLRPRSEWLPILRIRVVAAEEELARLMRLKPGWVRSLSAAVGVHDAELVDLLGEVLRAYASETITLLRSSLGSTSDYALSLARSWLSSVR